MHVTYVDSLVSPFRSVDSTANNFTVKLSYTGTRGDTRMEGSQLLLQLEQSVLAEQLSRTRISCCIIDCHINICACGIYAHCRRANAQSTQYIQGTVVYGATKTDKYTLAKETVFCFEVDPNKS